jgi:molecular chaperone GrpE
MNTMTDTTDRAPEAASADNGTPANGQPEAADVVAALVKENAEMKDRVLRTLAEMENLRRRTQREVADAKSYGITNFARDVLGVADNMGRAVGAIAPALRASEDASVKSLIDGVELTERELLKVLEKHGVRRFDPKGEKFDPNVHQAMFEVPDPSVPAGTVAQVIQPGYMLGERVLRPALVGVAKGGPKEGGAKENGSKDSEAKSTPLPENPFSEPAPANDNTGNNS